MGRTRTKATPHQRGPGKAMLQFELSRELRVAAVKAAKANEESLSNFMRRLIREELVRGGGNVA